MAVFSEFLAALIHEGTIAFGPEDAPRDRPTEYDTALLAEAYATFALGVAGPSIPFDARVAVEAAELVRQASWALVDRQERPASLRDRLRMTAKPLTPSEHLSADLTLRYLPGVIRRVRALDPSDPLEAMLVDVLRRWPLSGALADIDEPTLTPLDFGGHPGLLLLYAERLEAHDRPAWHPPVGSEASDYRQLIAGSNAPSLSQSNVDGLP